MAKKRSLRRYVTNIISFANSRNKNKFVDRSFLYFAGRITPEHVKLMADVWGPIVGPTKDILVIRVVKPRNIRTLGLSLAGSTLVPSKVRSVSETFPDESSVSSEPRQSSSGSEYGEQGSSLSGSPAKASEPSGTEENAPSRHFVHQVVPGGLFTAMDCVRPGDEFLQVNGYRLHGRSHKEVIHCLRRLPSHIELVIARSIDTQQQAEELPLLHQVDLDASIGGGESSLLHVAASEISTAAPSTIDTGGGGTSAPVSPLGGVEAAGVDPTSAKVSQWIHASRMSVNGKGGESFDVGNSGLLSPGPNAGNLVAGPSIALSSYARVGYKPTWSSVPLIVMLKRDKPGFGFSISVFDETLESSVDRSSTLDTRRSRLGRGTLKRSLSLGRSRRATVGGDLGSGRFATIDRTSSLGSNASSTTSSPLLVINQIAPGSCVDLDGRLSAGDRLLFVNDRKLTRASLGEAANVLQQAPLGYTMIGVAKMTLVPANEVAVEMGVGELVNPVPLNALSASSPQFASQFVAEDLDNSAAQQPLDYYTPLALDVEDVPYHAATLVVPQMDPSEEKMVRVTVDKLPLGCELDALAAGGVDGCRVVKVLRGGAIEKTAALVPGDYITRINSDNLRKVSNAEAFRVLRKASAECNTIEIGYYPRKMVVSHRSQHVETKAPSEDTSDYSKVDGSRPSSRLLENAPAVESIISTEALKQLQGEVGSNAWCQTRELKLFKLPEEDSWGIVLTGPDVWKEAVNLPALPPEITKPVFVASIVPNTASGRCGLLEPGDIIIGVNGMDATRVGCLTVAEWIQAANVVSSSISNGAKSSSSSAASGDESDSEWALLYLLVLPIRSPMPTAVNLSSIPPVLLANDLSNQSGEQDKDARPPSFLLNTSNLVRSAFVSSNESSSMEEPTSIASLEQHNDLPEPLGVANLEIAPPMQVPPYPTENGDGKIYNGLSAASKPLPPSPSPETQLSDGLDGLTIPPQQPHPVVQTIKSKSAWKNLGKRGFAASLAQLTQTYRRAALCDDEIHVVSINVANSSDSPPPGSAAAGGEENAAPVDCETGLGIRLVGHRDTNARGVFICSLREGSLADQTPGLQVTDEIVQVNNVCVMGLTHVSAKLLIAKEMELARRCAEGRILLVIRHNLVYNASVMARPAIGTAPSPCGHFLHHAALRTSASQEGHCSSKTALEKSAKEGDYEFLDVTIERDEKCGFGLCLVNMNPRRDVGVFVQSLVPASPAGMSGLVRNWDRIVAINGEAVREYDAALALLTKCRPSARLRLARSRSSSSSTSSSTQPGDVGKSIDLPRAFSPHDTPTPILNGVETTVELVRSTEDLGFSIVGGSDTKMGGVFIEKIHPSGTAHRDGRLRSGDRILAVDSVDLRSVPHSQATATLRATKNRLLVTVLRGSCLVPFSLSEVMQTFTATLQKSSGGPFGLVLENNATGGSVITDIIAGSPAARASVLHQGDVILEIDGLDVHKASAADVLSLLKQCSNHVVIKTGRLKPPAGYPIPRLRLFTVILSRASQKKNPKNNTPNGTLEFSSSAPTMPTGAGSSPSIFGVVLRPATSGERVYTPGTFVVDQIKSDSSAARWGMLQIGDRLLGIEREPVGWLSMRDLEVFTAGFDSLTFEFGRLPPQPPIKTSLTALNTLLLQAPPINLGLGCIRETDDEVVVSRRGELKASPEEQEDEEEEFAEEGDEDTNGQIRQIHLPPPTSPNIGLGLKLRRIRGDGGVRGQQVVVRIDPASPVAVCGLRVGDRILGVNDRLLLTAPTAKEAEKLIETNWRTVAGGSTLTLMRKVVPSPVVVREKPTSSSGGGGGMSEFLQGAATATVGLGLLNAGQGQRKGRRLHDVGDNIDVQWQAAPPGLLVPGMVAGATLGSLLQNGDSGGGADDFPKHLENGVLGADAVPPAAANVVGDFESRGEAIEVERAELNGGAGGGGGAADGVDGERGLPIAVKGDDEVIEGELIYNDPREIYAVTLVPQLKAWHCPSGFGGEPRGFDNGTEEQQQQYQSGEIDAGETPTDGGS